MKKAEAVQDKTKKKRIWLRVLLSVVGAMTGLVVLVLGLMTAFAFYPEDIEPVTVVGNAQAAPQVGTEIKIVSFNIGFAGLGAEEDFFMDGGTQVNPTIEVVEENLAGITEYLCEADADIYMLQEVDTASSRTGNIDQSTRISEVLGLGYAYARNYKAFVPYPIPMIGKVDSGICTYSSYNVTEAQRHQLLLTASWPVNTAYLKRCLLVERIPVEGTDKELVIINLHLEAYDDGEGRAAQTAQLCAVLSEEYEKGNYVIAGGDFNQSFEGGEIEMMDESLWTPGLILNSDLPEGFSMVFDTTVPSCRLLNHSYRGNEDITQLYIIDGFIVSDNVTVKSVNTYDADFEYSDHNPVELVIELVQH